MCEFPDIHLHLLAARVERINRDIRITFGGLYSSRFSGRAWECIQPCFSRRQRIVSTPTRHRSPKHHTHSLTPSLIMIYLAKMIVPVRHLVAARLISYPNSIVHSSPRDRRPYSDAVREKTSSTTQVIPRELKPTSLVEHVLYEPLDTARSNPRRTRILTEIVFNNSGPGWTNLSTGQGMAPCGRCRLASRAAVSR